MNFHYHGLSASQLDVLQKVSGLVAKWQFYLAGGTALAVYFAHRRSYDLDWFTSQPIADPLRLAQSLRDASIPFSTGQTAPGTLHGQSGQVNVTFLEYRYPLLQPLVLWPETGCYLASLDDLACMKLAAIAQRGARKDFIDLHTLLTHHRPLGELLPLYYQKFNVTDISPVLYGLAYFDDAEGEPELDLLWHLPWDVVKTDISSWLKEISK